MVTCKDRLNNLHGCMSSPREVPFEDKCFVENVKDPHQGRKRFELIQTIKDPHQGRKRFELIQTKYLVKHY